MVATSSSQLYRDAGIADVRSPTLLLGQSVLVRDGRIAWIRPADAEEDPGPAADLTVVDALGATIVPGMVDCHSHLTGPGGANWIERFADPAAIQAQVAEDNGELQVRSGVRWARDVGAAIDLDPVGILSSDVVAANGDELLAAAIGQLDAGADFVKLYLDGADPAIAPWSAADVRRVVEAVHARGAKVTAHSGRLSGARVGADGGVDSLEHGFELDADVAATMASYGGAVVSTLAVMASWLSFGSTTALPRFASAEGRARIHERLERAQESIRIAHAAGVRICAGTDFGGGSTRANQLAWEAESLVAAGLEPWEALAAATWRGGELLGEPEAGVIHEGGPADFFLVHGDPLSDPTAIWRVWKIA